MSVTVGIAYSLFEDASDLLPLIAIAAKKYGYGTKMGIDCAESDVKRGLLAAQNHMEWREIVFLFSPLGEPSSSGFEIHQEFVEFETMGAKPKFFAFLRDLLNLGSGKFAKFAVFFAGEWIESDRIRYGYGTIDDLESFLSLPGYWGVRFLSLETGSLHDSDEYPFLFDFTL